MRLFWLLSLFRHSLFLYSVGILLISHPGGPLHCTLQSYWFWCEVIKPATQPRLFQTGAKQLLLHRPPTWRARGALFLKERVLHRDVYYSALLKPYALKTSAAAFLKSGRCYGFYLVRWPPGYPPASAAISQLIKGPASPRAPRGRARSPGRSSQRSESTVLKSPHRQNRNHGSGFHHLFWWLNWRDSVS